MADKRVIIERVEDTFSNNKNELISYTKYYIVVDEISVEVKLDKTGQQLVDRYLK